MQLPEWTQGKWLSIGTTTTDTRTVYINETQLIIKMNGDQAIVHDLRFTRLMSSKRPTAHTFRLKAKSLDQW